MALQYIGARYVPKLFDSPQGGAAWVSGVAYEPLTIVTYANNSYTSRIPVPATVGAPNENPRYWVSTGVLNAYVESLRQEVETLSDGLDAAENDIDTLQTGLTALQSEVTADKTDLATFKKQYYNFKGRKVLFVGDSYAEGYSPDGSVTGWPARVAAILNLSDYQSVYHGGIGFTNTVDGLSFMNVADSVTNPESYTDVVICGGRNDVTAGLSTIVETVRNVIRHYQTRFVNALIHVGMIAYSGEGGIEMYKPYAAYLGGAQSAGAHYLYGVETAILNKSMMASDYKHPNATGQDNIAIAIASALKSGMFEQSANEPNVSMNGEVVSGGTIATKMIGDKLKIIWSRIASLSDWAGAAFNSSGKVSINLGTQDIGIRFYSAYQLIPVTVTIGYDPSGANRVYKTVPAWFKFSQTGLYLDIQSTNKDNTGWASGTVKFLEIMPGSALISIWD